MSPARAALIPIVVSSTTTHDSTGVPNLECGLEEQVGMRLPSRDVIRREDRSLAKQPAQFGQTESELSLLSLALRGHADRDSQRP